MLRRRRNKHAATGTTDADQRLTEAKDLQAQTEKYGPAIDRLHAEAQRMAKRNRIAEIVYHGLLGGD